MRFKRPKRNRVRMAGPIDPCPFMNTILWAWSVLCQESDEGELERPFIFVVPKANADVTKDIKIVTPAGVPKPVVGAFINDRLKRGNPLVISLMEGWYLRSHEREAWPYAIRLHPEAKTMLMLQAHFWNHSAIVVQCEVDEATRERGVPIWRGYPPHQIGGTMTPNDHEPEPEAQA